MQLSCSVKFCLVNSALTIGKVCQRFPQILHSNITLFQVFIAGLWGDRKKQ